MSRLCGGGGVAEGGSKHQMGVVSHYGPPPALYHLQADHAPFQRAPLPARKKTWTFITDSLSYDTFFTMKRLIERSQRTDEVLRWISQNPSKVSHSHLAVALQRISQLLQAMAPRPETTPSRHETTPPGPETTATEAEVGGAKVGDRKWTLEHHDFLSLCDAIERNATKLDNYSLVNSLYSTANIGLTPDRPVVRVLESECLSRVAHFNQKDLSMVFSSVMRLHLQLCAAPPSPIKVPVKQLEASPLPSAQPDPVDRALTDAPVGGALTEAPVGGALTEAPVGGSQTKAPVGGALTEVSVGRALIEACLSGLERSLERERHPQTLFLLLAFYRRRWRELTGESEHSEWRDMPTEEQGQSVCSETDLPTATTNQELLITNRKILRLVKHTLSCVSAVRDQEMALLDEMLAVCVSEASNRSLELIFSSHLFHQNRQEKFIKRLAEELPVKADSLSPHTMALIAKYTARHRLRETRLLDVIAEYLLTRAETLDSKVIQRLVFPFSRMSYSPQNAPVLWARLEQVLEVKALSSPLATVNILMSLFQLRFCPERVLQKVFSASFINDLTKSPYSGIVRRYLSLLDSAVELEFRTYSGPRLSPVHKVQMFDHVLTADEANRKYSYKGLVAEALRQLVGEHGYRQDQVLAPGYSTDFLLWIDSSRRVLPIRSSKPTDPCVTSVSGWQVDVSGLAADLKKFSLEPSEKALPVASLHHMTSFYPADQEVHRLVLSVNDKWHYCHNSTVLVGSRAMRERHLQLLGFTVLQLPYQELEKLNGIDDVKKYIQHKLSDLDLNQV